MLCFRDVGTLSDVDSDVFFKGDSSEEINFKGDMVFDEPLQSITDSDDASFLDEVGVFAFEESVGRGSLISKNAVDHGDF